MSVETLSPPNRVFFETWGKGTVQNMNFACVNRADSARRHNKLVIEGEQENSIPRYSTRTKKRGMAWNFARPIMLLTLRKFYTGVRFLGLVVYSLKYAKPVSLLLT